MMFIKILMQAWIILFNRLQLFNSYFLVQFIGRISILVLFLHNQEILKLNNEELLYLIIIISFIQLFYFFILSVINLIIYLNLQQFKNNYFNLCLNIFKIVGLILLLNKIYRFNSEFLIFNELLLYMLLYCIITLIITEFKIVINKLKNSNYKIINILTVFSFTNLIRATNISDISNNDDDKNKLINIKDNNNNDVNSDNVLSGNTTNIGVHVHTEEIVKKGLEGISRGIEKGVIQGASQIGLAGSIGAGMTAGVSMTAGHRPSVRIATSVGLGVAGGLIHVGASTLNRNITQREFNNNNTINNNDNPPSPSDGFINNPNDNINILDNSVELFLYCIWGLMVIVLLFLFLLLYTVISKLIISLNYKFNWLDKIFSKEKSIKVRSVIFKILNFMSKLRDFNILMFIIVLIIISACNLYFFTAYLYYLEDMCKLYLKILAEHKK